MAGGRGTWQGASETCVDEQEEGKEEEGEGEGRCCELDYCEDFCRFYADP